jgi:hypothetical protein
MVSLTIAVKPHKRSVRLHRRKSILINKAHEMAEFCDIIFVERPRGRVVIPRNIA